MNTPANVVIEVENLSRSYRRKEALKNVTLRVPEGSVFGLVGENGAGKTSELPGPIVSVALVFSSVARSIAIHANVCNPLKI